MTPIFKLEVNDTDITEKINLNASKIEFKDEAELISDEISVQIEGIFKRPKYEDRMKLWIGTKKDELMYCGEFKVQTVSVSMGQADCMNITATATDFSAQLKVKRSQSYENTSLKKIAHIIAKRNGLLLSSDLDDIYLLHVEQTRESDLSFLHRLCKEYNALFAIKNQTLVFKKKIFEGQKSKELGMFDLHINQIASAKITPSNKTDYKSCKAVWRDSKENTEKSLVVGEGEPQLLHKEQFENESEAKAKALAQLQKAQEGLKTGSISCTGFNVYAGGILNLSGTFEDDDIYWIKSVKHTLDSSGWNISMEIAN
jgi:phage protein D